MNTGTAMAIFKNLESEKYSDEEKALAIYTVMNMETHNSINKDYMLKAIKWLWHRQYEIIEDGKQEEPKKLTNFGKIKAITIEEFAKKFSSSICENIGKCCDYDDCNDCIMNWLNKEVEPDVL